MTTELGRLVKARRKALFMTQEALASAAKVHRTYIGYIEQGKRQVPRRDVLLRLASILGVPEQEMVSLAVLGKPKPERATSDDENLLLRYFRALSPHERRNVLEFTGLRYERTGGGGSGEPSEDTSDETA